MARLTAQLPKELVAAFGDRAHELGVTKAQLFKDALNVFLQKNDGEAGTKSQSGVVTERPRRIVNRAQAARYAKYLLSAFDEVLEFNSSINHNLVRPALWVDDVDFVKQVSLLVQELRILNAILEAKNKSRGTNSQSVELAIHFNTFLGTYAKSMGKGAAGLTTGTIASFLYYLGIDHGIISQILSHIK